MKNPSKVGRCDIHLRKEEVRMIRNIERLEAELQAHAFPHREILHQRQIQVRETGTAHHVASFISKLTGLRHRIEPSKRAAAHPLIRRVRTSIGVLIRSGRLE